MIDHVSIGVSDISRSIAFYDSALAPLGVKRLVAYGDAEAPDHVGYGRGNRPYFWLRRGEPTQGYVHLAFTAAARELVDAFHAAALEAGGRNNGRPGLRAQYHAGYYGAFVLDPDGCNVEAVHHDLGQKATPRASN